jgi:N-acetylneuraminate synthase/N,N'-diacetyllegionaminate synthase
MILPKKASKTLLIAEVGHNWVPFGWDSVEDHIRLAKDCNWDIVKFQAYDTDKIKKPGETNYEELKVAELSFDQLKEAKNIADSMGIEFMASAFDVERVQWLEELEVKRHKVASRIIHNEEVLDAMQKTGKPIIASLAEWKNLKLLPPIANCKYLYCKSRRQILIGGFDFEELDWAIDVGLGFSDHTAGERAAAYSIMNGVNIVEKHITLDMNAAGWDQPSSSEFDGMMYLSQLNGRK